MNFDVKRFLSQLDSDCSEKSDPFSSVRKELERKQDEEAEREGLAVTKRMILANQDRKIIRNI